MKVAYWLLLTIVFGQSSLSLVSSVDEIFTTSSIVSGEITEPSESCKDLENLKTLLRQVSVSTGNNNTINATRQGPCECAGGLCGCCSRILYQTWRQKVCVNITYEPEEFSFTANILMNDRVIYTRTVSGKNPRPICVPFPRIPFVRACVRFYNIYFQSRNIHMCVNLEGKVQNNVIFQVSLDCLRFGANGLALLKPEDGGGLGQVEFFPENNNEEDYSDEYEDDDDDDDDDDLF